LNLRICKLLLVQHKEDEQKIFMELCINKETALNLKQALETVKKAFEDFKATDREEFQCRIP
jgi:hypothetical protein